MSAETKEPMPEWIRSVWLRQAKERIAFLENALSRIAADDINDDREDNDPVISLRTFARGSLLGLDIKEIRSRAKARD